MYAHVELHIANCAVGSHNRLEFLDMRRCWTTALVIDIVVNDIGDEIHHQVAVLAQSTKLVSTLER